MICSFGVSIYRRTEIDAVPTTTTTYVVLEPLWLEEELKPCDGRLLNDLGHGHRGREHGCDLTS